MPFYVLRVSQDRSLLLALEIDGRGKEPNRFLAFDSKKADQAFAEVTAGEANALVMHEDGRGFGNAPGSPFSDLDALRLWLKNSELEAVVTQYMSERQTAKVESAAP